MPFVWRISGYHASSGYVQEIRPNKYRTDIIAIMVTFLVFLIISLLMFKLYDTKEVLKGQKV